MRNANTSTITANGRKPTKTLSADERQLLKAYRQLNEQAQRTTVSLCVSLVPKKKKKQARLMVLAEKAVNTSLEMFGGDECEKSRVLAYHGAFSSGQGLANVVARRLVSENDIPGGFYHVLELALPGMARSDTVEDNIRLGFAVGLLWEASVLIKRSGLRFNFEDDADHMQQAVESGRQACEKISAEWDADTSEDVEAKEAA